MATATEDTATGRSAPTKAGAPGRRGTDAPGSATEAIAAGSRERILDAALTTFLERGVDGASIDDVLAASGASVGSLYHHFRAKQGLAGAVFVAALSSFQDAFAAELRRHPDAEGGVRGGVRAHLRWCLEAEPDYARFLLFHGDAARGAASSALTERNRDFFADVRAWWAPHVHYGTVRDLDDDLLYALWLGPAQEYARLALSGRSLAGRRRAQSVLAGGAWQALRRKGG